MKKYNLVLILLIFAINLKADEAKNKTIYSVAKFVNSELAKKLIVQDDDYSRSLSKFDIDMRVHDVTPTLDNLNKFTQNQVLDWTDREKFVLDSLTKIISVEAENFGFHFQLPDEIYFIKTTMNENKGAGGYTRLNYIVLSKDVTSMSLDQIKSVIAHELFHVISRYNPTLRAKLYSLIGFTVCNKIAITTNLKNYTIANPDAPNIDAYIILKDSLGNDIDCAMVLYSKKDYTKGIMFDYINVGFLKLIKSKDGNMELYTNNGNEKIYSIREVSNFFEQIGKNTRYIIHPEEIMASNFALLFEKEPKIQSPELIKKIESVFIEN